MMIVTPVLSVWPPNLSWAQLNSPPFCLKKIAKKFSEQGLHPEYSKTRQTRQIPLQFPNDWHETLSTTYKDLGYLTSRTDPCVQIKKENGNYTITNTYTDDIFGASNSDDEIKRRKEEVGKVWEIKDVGEMEYFLGMQVQQDLRSGTMRLTQRPYWEHVINRFHLDHVPPRNVPLPPGIILNHNMSPKTESEKKIMDEKPYRSILGSAMWGQLAMHLDLSFSVSLLTRFQASPGVDHWNMFVTIFFLCSFLVIIVPLHLSIFPLNFHLFHMHSIAVHTQPHTQSCCLHIASCTVLCTATFPSIRVG